MIHVGGWNSVVVYTFRMDATADKHLYMAHFEAIVLDLDGVITRTAKVHAAAWKTMFDDFLSGYATDDNPFPPFSVDTDYYQYVDGKPRYDGVRSFLASRGVSLPEGNPSDPENKKTVCGLGNRKNHLFLQKLKTDGVEVFDSTVAVIHTLRRNGYRTAVVSSSRNCQEVLKAAGLSELFDARVDGKDLQSQSLSGKPAPDMFIEACRRIDSIPQRTIAVEDAVAGVQAAKTALMGCVIGVNRGDNEGALREYADMVITDLSELRIIKGEDQCAESMPTAFDCLEKLIPEEAEELALFLDYDGTLTPIVPNPKDAVLSESMQRILQRLSSLCELAVISGRDLADVRDRVGIANIWYAGSHGFDIAGPDTRHTEYQEGTAYLDRLDKAEASLREKLEGIPGSMVERKRFSIAVHYRQVADKDIETIERIVKKVRADSSGLRLSRGKKIFEIQPDIDWNKGKALQWMLRFLSIDTEQALVAYIGDDTTDEDAFRAISPMGVGILVTQHPKSTNASCYLDDPDAVGKFLKQLADALEEKS